MIQFLLDNGMQLFYFLFFIHHFYSLFYFMFIIVYVFIFNFFVFIFRCWTGNLAGLTNNTFVYGDFSFTFTCQDLYWKTCELNSSGVMAVIVGSSVFVCCCFCCIAFLTCWWCNRSKQRRYAYQKF
jgi:hypothetical protein